MKLQIYVCMNNSDDNGYYHQHTNSTVFLLVFSLNKNKQYIGLLIFLFKSSNSYCVVLSIILII